MSKIEKYSKEDLDLIISRLKESGQFHLGSHSCNGESFCPVKCWYCYENTLPNDMKMERHLNLITKEDFMACVEAMKHKMYNDNVWGLYIGSKFCDTFLHPDALEFMYILRKTFPANIVNLVSTCVFLNMKKAEQFVKFINNNVRLRFRFSVLTLVDEVREWFFGIPNTKVIRYILENLNYSKVNIIDPCINHITTLEDFEKSVHQLVHKYKVGEMTIRFVHASKYANEGLKEMANKSQNDFEEIVRIGKKYVGLGTKIRHERLSDKHYFIDEKLDYYPEFREMRFKNVEARKFSARIFAKTNKNKKIIFCSSEAFYNYWKDQFDEVDNIEVIKIKNYYWGGTYKCAGLISWYDIEQNIKEKKITDFDTLLLPKEMNFYYGKGKDYQYMDKSYLVEKLGRDFTVKFL